MVSEINVRYGFSCFERLPEMNELLCVAKVTNAFRLFAFRESVELSDRIIALPILDYMKLLGIDFMARNHLAGYKQTG
jgi:hypothetical protein